MSWLRIDDQMADHPKLMGLGPDRHWAITLQVYAMCWASRHLTDGFIPVETAEALTHGFPASRDWPALMVRAGLWEKAKVGWRVHDYLAYNPSRVQVLASREAARERMTKLRNGSPNVRTNIGEGSPENLDSPSPSPTPTARSNGSVKGKSKSAPHSGAVWERS